MCGDARFRSFNSIYILCKIKPNCVTYCFTCQCHSNYHAYDMTLGSQLGKSGSDYEPWRFFSLPKRHVFSFDKSLNEIHLPCPVSRLRTCNCVYDIQ